jgi:alkanesulfonate monooxygenase SsuD/methylene tetrahydromethanopterin reductase-like flavin-dependent oxidoreductase (luciferase family)
MEFGIFSNGFRPQTTAAQTYAEDIYEIVLADQLGFRDAYISEHQGESPYIGRIDISPAPDLMICKAAGLTKQIRMGAAVRMIHGQHPFDVAIQAAVTDHLVGEGRYIFGFGSGFPNPLFCEERGLTFDDRHSRLHESLDFILKCWESAEPFDWDGEHWQAKGAIALPKPLTSPHMPMATATDSEAMIKIAGERGYTLLSAFLEPPERLRKKAQIYAQAARDAGRPSPLKGVTASRLVYIADTEREAIEALRPAVTHEIGLQAERGFLNVLSKLFGVDVPNNEHAIEVLVEAGFYVLGDCDSVAQKLTDFHEAAGGFGTFLYVAGKDWTTRENRARSMRLFMEQVAPQLRHLEPPENPEPI